MVDLNKLLLELTDDDVIDIMISLGCEEYKEQDDAIIFPTICHHEAAEDGSLKLYYYKENKLFHCYTECSSSFNIFTLIEKVWSLRGGNKVKTKRDKKDKNDFCFFDTVQYIVNRSGKSFDIESGTSEAYKSEKQRYARKNRLLKLETFPSGLLDIFDKAYPIEWIDEGISKESMDVFDIRYSISRNKIIIPHFNTNGELVGIRGRALNEEEVEQFGKYMPVEIEGKWYAHPLSQNLYGLDLAAPNIKRIKKVIILEGEKSCLKYYDFYGKENNISVACCGSSINKAQIDLLLKTCWPEEIIIAFDKEFENPYDEKGQKYFSKLYDLGKKYSNYANFSFIFDKDNLLGLKDSPVDKGIDIYEKLFKERIVVK